ncbi:sensor histidine kinase [Lacisediminihabitans sp. FW035]
MSIRRWMLVLAAMPFLIGGVIAIVLALSARGVSARVTVPLPVVALEIGLGLSAVATLGLAIAAISRRTRERSLALGRVEGEERQRQAHRRFLARLDHELKNPITAINAAVAAADEPSSTPLRVIDSQSRRLTSLVSELRKLADLETKPIECEPVDLEELTADVVAAVSEHLETTGGGTRQFHIVFPQAPWPIARVIGDVDLLFLALYNLVSNAAKYSEAGSSIEVRGSEDDGWAVIEVADTGAGIAAHEVDLVWDELARGENSRGIPGSGLGLSLVNAVVLRHGGQASLRSREGQGTSVRVRLPLTPGSRPPGSRYGR